MYAPMLAVKIQLSRVARPSAPLWAVGAAVTTVATRQSALGPGPAPTAQGRRARRPRSTNVKSPAASTRKAESRSAACSPA